MKIPNQLRLQDIQESFREVERQIEPLRTGNINMSGRRVIGAGNSVAPFDYVTRFELEEFVFAKTTVQTNEINGLLNAASEIRYGLFAQRGAATAYINTLFVATDRDYIGWISTGAAWIYVFGMRALVQANIAAFAAELTTNDARLGLEVTDYDHVLQWSGSAWGWGPGEVGSGFYQLFEDAPTSAGASAWQICDGTTIAKLNADGTTTNVTVPDLTTAAYLKGGITSAAIAAASGTVANTTAPNQAAATGVTVDAHAVIQITDVAGANDWLFDNQADAAHTVNDPTHNHTQDAHSHAPGTLELRNKQCRTYFRR